MTAHQQFLLIYIVSLLTLLYFLKKIVISLFFNHKRLALIAKGFYNYFYSIEKISHLRTNNWGYVPVDKEIENYYPRDLQCGMQLYKELVTNQNGYIIHNSYSVAEIGCGKGAGAEFLITKFNPKKYIGIDYSQVAINFCISTYDHLKNANFICADAHILPIESNSVDIVINVESSHIYRDVGKFFKEVHRILKKDGKFLLTDFRVIKNIPIDILESIIYESGFSIAEKRIITQQIYKSCALASKRRKELVKAASPWLLKKFFYHYAVIEGTKKFKKLGNGEIVYFLYHLEKLH